MVDEKMGPMLAAIGQLVADILDEHDPDGAVMYAEAEEMYQTAAIYKDLGNVVLCRQPDDALFEAIEDLWEAAEPDKKWRVLTYEISGGRFSAAFKFPDQIDPDEFQDDRQNRYITERFGDKPFDYEIPEEPSEGAFEL